MKSLPVSNETHERVVLLQEADNLDTDSLVNIALDAFEMMVALHTAREEGDGIPLSYRRWGERYDAMREGMRYIEAKVYGGLRGA